MFIVLHDLPYYFIIALLVIFKVKNVTCILFNSKLQYDQVKKYVLIPTKQTYKSLFIKMLVSQEKEVSQLVINKT